MLPGDGGPADQATLNQPHSIQFEPVSGDLFICDIMNHRVRRVSRETSLISTFAGTGGKQATPDGGQISEVSKEDEGCIEREELCIKNEELCIENEEL